jgi:hypothetical protein
MYIRLSTAQERVNTCLSCENFNQETLSCSLCHCPVDDIWSSIFFDCPDNRFSPIDYEGQLQDPQINDLIEATKSSLKT